ncbi:MAG: aminotransferase class V-fold PLP-dependent enzyme [Caldilineaceae bacterium]|nr:aminotransferase class V-fold PLP-dependent enzyme [Caldilineaceae bacterium]
MTLSLPLPNLAAQYLLDPQVIYLNHGSFGAVPRPVFQAYQHWQRELEANPVDFLGRRAPGLLADARQALGAFINATGDDLAFVPNVTYAMNIVARALPLEEGDEILSTDHEYGAIDRAWRFKCEKSGARLVRRPVSLPVVDRQQAAEQIWGGVNERTRVISLSHITSPTALILPVEEICTRASEAGILTVIDGAHAPGQIDLDMQEIGADFYCGNCHKWLSSARGAGFLYARPGRQHLLEPLVVSHGWRSESPGPSPFLDNFSWSGTIDPAAYLSVPAAIDFWEENDWPEVSSACHRLLAECEERILALSGLPPISPETMWAQMRLVLLPGSAESYGPHLEENRIVVPVGQQRGHTGIRISVQAYNCPADLDRLVQVLRDAAA